MTKTPDIEGLQSDIRRLEQEKADLETKLGESNYQELQSLRAQVETLMVEKEKLTKDLKDVSNMLRLTLGVSLVSCPKTPQFQGMVDRLFVIGGGNG